MDVQGSRSVIKLLTDPDIVVGDPPADTGDTALLHGQGDGKPLLIDAGIDPKVVVPQDEIVTTSGEDRATFPGASRRERQQGRARRRSAHAGAHGDPPADLTRLSFVKVLIWEPTQ